MVVLPLLVGLLALSSPLPADDRHGAQAAAERLLAKRGGEPIWMEAGHPTRQALEVVEVLLDAGSRGLVPSDYDAQGLADEVAARAVDPLPAPVEAAAMLDLALSRAVFRYAGDVGRGRVDPLDLGLDWPASPPLDLVTLGTELAQAEDPAAELAALEPRWPGYLALRAALVDHPEAARAISLSLERWRWLPSEPLEPTVLVNLAEYRLDAYEPGRLEPVLSMPVVVGRADDATWHTPIMARALANVVLAPYWEVPRRLATVDLVPRLETDPGFSRRFGYEMAGPNGSEPVSADSLARWKAGRLKLRQAPGPLNALGHVLLLFPNSQDIYLHDSPDRRFFERPRRAYSHGCVRVGDAASLASFALRGTPGWDDARLAEALSGLKTTWLQPARRSWVFLTYATASVAADGRLLVHDDLYGEDARLERALRGGDKAVARYQERGGPESRWTKSSSG
jgi:murein L,D-transpeptidase YcbB/YkuD